MLFVCNTYKTAYKFVDPAFFKRGVPRIKWDISPFKCVDRPKKGDSNQRNALPLDTPLDNCIVRSTFFNQIIEIKKDESCISTMSLSRRLVNVVTNNWLSIFCMIILTNTSDSLTVYNLIIQPKRFFKTRSPYTSKPYTIYITPLYHMPRNNYLVLLSIHFPVPPNISFTFYTKQEKWQRVSTSFVLRIDFGWFLRG